MFEVLRPIWVGEKTKPIDIPKQEIKEEKPNEIPQNSVPTIPRPKYFKPNMKFVKQYGHLYN